MRSDQVFRTFSISVQVHVDTTMTMGSPLEEDLRFRNKKMKTNYFSLPLIEHEKKPYLLNIDLEIFEKDLFVTDD